MAGNRGGQRTRVRRLPVATRADDGKLLLAASDTADGFELGLPAPLGGVLLQEAGCYISRHALDKWRYTIEPNRRVVVIGDSTAQGFTGALDSWPERLNRDLSNWNGPRLSAGPGFYGLWRAGRLLGGINGDGEWFPAGTGQTAGARGWTQATAADPWDLAPYGQAFLAAGAAVTAATGTATGAAVGSRVVNATTAVFTSAMIGKPIVCSTTANVFPLGATITALGNVAGVPYGDVSAGSPNASCIISHPALQANNAGTYRVFAEALIWWRPLGPNSSRMVFDYSCTGGSTTITSPSANFTQADVGRLVLAFGFAASTVVYITAVTDYQTATVNVAAAASANGVLMINDGRVVTDLATTNASTLVTSATANFTSDDINQRIKAAGLANVYIRKVLSPTQVDVSAAASVTATGVTAHIQSARAARHDINVSLATSAPHVTLNTGAFTTDDIGRQVVGSGIPDNTYITAVTNSTQATLSAAPAFAMTSNAFFSVASTTPVNVAHIELLFVNGFTGLGSPSYKATQTTTAWIAAITGDTASPPRLERVVFTQTNPTCVIIRATTNVAAGAAAKTIFCGMFTYAVAPASASNQYRMENVPGMMLYNMAMDGEALADLMEGGVGDRLAIFDPFATANSPVQYRGLRPDLVVVMFSNDVTQSNDLQWRNNLNKLLARVHSYADVLLVGCYEQDLRNRLDQARFRTIMRDVALNTATPAWSIGDVSTTNTDATITSNTIRFGQGDVGKTITGNGIPAGTTIASINSVTSAEMSANATATATDVFVTITGSPLDTRQAYLDLYEAYAAEGAAGYHEANAAGLMYDALHQSQLGHRDIGARISRMIRLLS